MGDYEAMEDFLNPGPPALIYLQWTGDDMESTWSLDMISDDDEPYYRHCISANFRSSNAELLAALELALVSALRLAHLVFVCTQYSGRMGDIRAEVDLLRVLTTDAIAEVAS